MDSRPSRSRPMAKRLLFLMAPGVDAISSADCWVGGWTPEICCSAPGAKGNPLCWDSVFTFDRCCTETEEGIQFDLRRRNFVADMVRRGATVHFDIRHVSGGRTGAVASRALSARSTVLRVPSTQVFSLKSVHSAVIEASRLNNCDAHAVLGLGLALERVNPSSVLADWIKLLPLTFANVLWFSARQLELVRKTFFSYIVQNWFEDLDCMERAVREMNPNLWRGRSVSKEDLRWALSVVKTRGFAFEGTRESTMLIPLADFLNHNMVASVRTATLAEDALRFVATKDVMPGDELCIDYAQASNLEFLVRYGFRVEDNPYGGRQFELGGEPMQVCEQLRYVILSSGKRPVSVRVVHIGAPPDLSIPRYQFDPVTWEELPWQGCSCVFQLDERHIELMKRVQALLSSSPLGPLYQLVPPECLSLNAVRLLDPFRRPELSGQSQSIVTESSGEEINWRACYEEVHRRLEPIFRSAPWTYWPMRFDRADCTSVTLMPTGPGAQDCVTSWVKAVEEACGLRNAASVREMLTFNFAFEVFPVEGENIAQVRRDLVREIKSMLEKEWDVMDFRCPTLAVWQTKSTWLPFQASYVPVAPTP